MSNALIIVDVQHDFLPGGALSVSEGYGIIPPLVELASTATLVVASRDWHPGNHISFSNKPDYKTTFPTHCVKGTYGARLDNRIDAVADVILSKGTDKDKEAFSAFSNPVLGPMLRHRVRHTDELIIGGLATNFCVLETVKDAMRHGFLTVVVYRDTVRGINLGDNRDDEDAALTEMAMLGADIR